MRTESIKQVEDAFSEVVDRDRTVRCSVYGPQRPVYHDGCIELQFPGWMIVLTPEGRWFLDATDGG